jgi:hypothetical protein
LGASSGIGEGQQSRGVDQDLAAPSSDMQIVQGRSVAKLVDDPIDRGVEAAQFASLLPPGSLS